MLAYERLHVPTKNLGDITKIEKLPKADMWTYSFPCTDISLAERLVGMLQVEMSDVEKLIKISDKQDAEELKRYLEIVKGLLEKVQA